MVCIKEGHEIPRGMASWENVALREGTDHDRMERILERWRTQGERQDGIGGVGWVEGHRMA